MKRCFVVDDLAGVKANADLPDLLQELRRWADLLDRAGDDFNIKRNLILGIVKNVRCIDREGHIEIAVMTKGKKWRPEWGLVITFRRVIDKHVRKFRNGSLKG